MYRAVPDIYPPISRLHSGSGESELRSAIGISNDDPIPRRLALALRIPDARDPEFNGDMARVHREVDLVSRLIDRDREVVELHVEFNAVGGQLHMESVRDLSEALRHQFHFSPDPASEYSITVDPRTILPEQLESLAPYGFNRIVFQEIPVEPAMVRFARACGMRSICIVAAGAEEAIECAQRLRPERLTIEGPVGDARALPGQPHDLANCLQVAEYLHLGLGHYALPHDDLATAFTGFKLEYGPRGFMAHAECDVIGLGPGSISRVGGYLSQNSESCAAWRLEIDTGRLSAHRGLWLTCDDELRAELMQQLLCRREIGIRELEQHYAIDFRSYFAADLSRLAPCLRLGMVRDSGDRIAVCSRGWPWLRNIAQCFDPGAGDGRWPQEASPRH